MNSHDRRVSDRYWPWSVEIEGDALAIECFGWLNKTLGSSSFKRKKMPRWCWRPYYISAGNFSVYQGTMIFFHSEKDYVAFLLKWDR